MIERLVSILLADRDFGHRAHWRTKSYAQHMALGDFYDPLPGFADELVECWQGCEQELADIPATPSVAAKEPLAHITARIAEFRKIRRTLDDVPEFQNQIDTIVSHYQKTAYKLRFLG